MPLRRLLSGLTGWALFGLGIASARACPGCQESVTTANAGEVLAGFSLSVLFMIAAVFCALAGLAALIVRAARRVEAARARAGDPGLPRA